MALKSQWSLMVLNGIEFFLKWSLMEIHGPHICVIFSWYPSGFTPKKSAKNDHGLSADGHLFAPLVCVWLHTGSRCQLCRKKTRLWLTGPGDCPLFVSKIEPKDGSFAVRQMSPTVSLPTPAARLMFCKLLHCEPTGRKSMNVTAHLFTISIHFPSEETRS